MRWPKGLYPMLEIKIPNARRLASLSPDEAGIYPTSFPVNMVFAIKTISFLRSIKLMHFGGKNLCLTSLCKLAITTTVNWQGNSALYPFSSPDLGIAARASYRQKIRTPKALSLLALLPKWWFKLSSRWSILKSWRWCRCYERIQLGSFPFGSRQCTGNRQPVFAISWTCNRAWGYRLCDVFVPDYRRNC